MWQTALADVLIAKNALKSCENDFLFNLKPGLIGQKRIRFSASLLLVHYVSAFRKPFIALKSTEESMGIFASSVVFSGSCVI